MHRYLKIAKAAVLQDRNAWEFVSKTATATVEGGLSLGGDAENDVEMLRYVGLGVAMRNAKPPALAAADVVVGSNDEDGVAEAVRTYVLTDVQ